MSGPITLTFVGGPEDGKRVALRTVPATRRYRVAVLPRLPVYVDVDTPEAEVEFEQFEYEIERVPGENYVAYPVSWNDLPTGYPFERIMKALLRGYVGRQQ